MQTKSYAETVTWLTLAGVLFSGYLSAEKLFSGTCPFREPCPYFLGYPACWYGFVMFLAMFLIALSARRNSLEGKSAANAIAVISLAGAVFSGYFVTQELLRWIATGEFAYSLGLPTCAYGLIFYILIFVLSGMALGRRR